MTQNSDDTNSRLKLLEILVSNEGEIIPGRVLAEELKSSRQAIHKLINALKEEGLEIESIPQKGYRIKDFKKTDVISPTLIDLMIKGNKLFHTCLFFDEVDSTQSIIKKLALQDAPEGIVAVSDFQTQGRGRRGRTWCNARGKNLMFSMLLRPNMRTGDIQLLNLAAGLAVHRVLKNIYDIDAELKWPNDILVKGKKICGILSESAGEPDRIYFAVTGIGLNVNMTREDLGCDLDKTATSLFIETKNMIPRPILLRDILDVFSDMTEDIGAKEKIAKLLLDYRAACATIGREVRVIQDELEFSGTALDITEQGALVVRTEKSDMVFAAADVHHLRLKA